MILLIFFFLQISPLSVEDAICYKGAEPKLWWNIDWVICYHIRQYVKKTASIAIVIILYGFRLYSPVYIRKLHLRFSDKPNGAYLKVFGHLPSSSMFFHGRNVIVIRLDCGQRRWRYLFGRTYLSVFIFIFIMPLEYALAHYIRTCIYVIIFFFYRDLFHVGLFLFFIFLYILYFGMNRCA